jgi:hypothetical protein
MAHTTCLVCLISAVNGRNKKNLGIGGASSGHITNLKQSMFLFQHLWFQITKKSRHLFFAKVNKPLSQNLPKIKSRLISKPLKNDSV